MLKVLDLFSGIGGFALGLQQTGGFETIAFCEIEEYAQRVLRKHWPEVPIHNDIKELDGEQYRGSVDVICGGWPCQPFSTAGDRRGESDDRHLWPEFNRLISQVEPRWVIGENVVGHITMGLDQVLSDLEGQGYSIETFVIPACALNAPHRRDRVWVIANACGERLQGCAESGESERACSTEQPRSQTSRGNIEALPNRSPWESESGILRVVDGVSSRVDRLKGLGNAVCPPIVSVIGQAILKAEAENRAIEILKGM